MEIAGLNGRANFEASGVAVPINVLL